MKKKVIVIGAGFAGLAAATALADKGFDVTIVEKNTVAGGRARVFEVDGFVFDMGPSWYWMPDIFEDYFARFGKKPADYYQLVRLDPSYQVVFEDHSTIQMPATMTNLEQLFEQMEAGVTPRLREFLKQAAYKYDVGIHKFVWKPSHSITEYLSLKLLYDALRIDVFQSFSTHIRKFFSNERLLKLMEFPILFLGATPENTPAMYSLMNFAEITMGTWYPMGGMFKIVEGMVALAEEKGVKILLNHEVSHIGIENGKATYIEANGKRLTADVVVSGADYHHTDTKLIDTTHHNYSDAYWDKRVMAPSCLLYYIGVNRKVDKLLHHTLFFDEDFKQHSFEIYTEPQFPSKPLFYVAAPSVTDASVAPDGCENLFILIPVAPNLQGSDTPDIREKYYNMVMERLEYYVGHDIRSHVVYKRTYAHSDFVNDYHAFKGNAYGLANTLWQTAFLKPSLKNKKVSNLYYTGQLTVPGPGVPPSLISGLVVAEEVGKTVSV